MAKSKTKTQPGTLTVDRFIASLATDTRRTEAATLVKLFEKVTGWKAMMWGTSIVGFGKYAYTYDSGRSGEICVVGFSPRKPNLVIYAKPDPTGKTAELLTQLGKHKGGLESCLYVNKLADIDVAVLEKLIRVSVATLKKMAADKGWPVSAT